MTENVTRQLVAYHIARLKDKSVDARLKAVHELEELSHEDALPALQELYKSDLDAQVRQAAQAAGRAIFLKQKNRPS